MQSVAGRPFQPTPRSRCWPSRWSKFSVGYYEFSESMPFLQFRRPHSPYHPSCGAASNRSEPSPPSPREKIKPASPRGNTTNPSANNSKHAVSLRHFDQRRPRTSISQLPAPYYPPPPLNPPLPAPPRSRGNPAPDPPRSPPPRTPGASRRSSPDCHAPSRRAGLPRRGGGLSHPRRRSSRVFWSGATGRSSNRSARTIRRRRT